MLYFTLKFLHVVGAAVLLGTGAGIAFFMLMACQRQPRRGRRTTVGYQRAATNLGMWKISATG